MIFINNNAFSSYVFVLVWCLLITAISAPCVDLVAWFALSFTVVLLSLSDEANYLSHFLQLLASRDRECYCAVAALYQPCITRFIDVFVDVGVCVCLLLLYTLCTLVCCLCLSVYFCLTFLHGANFIEWNSHGARSREKECFDFSFSRSPLFAHQKNENHRTIDVNGTLRCGSVCIFDYDFFLEIAILLQ